MRLYELHRTEDETGISGTGIVAQMVQFDDGTCVLRWLSELKSTAVYGHMRDVAAIHGHNGKTKIVLVGDAFHRGMLDAQQDSFENAPFACAGGLENRRALKAPEWITPAERPAWLEGYKAAARLMYGNDWQTCTFGWQAALTIGGDKSPPDGAGES